MPIEAILLLQPSDISCLKRHAVRYQGQKLLFIDPGLVERAAVEGVSLENFEFRQLAVGPHFQARVASEATRRAAALDQSLTRERERLFGPGMWQGWDQSLLRQFFIRTCVYQGLGQVADQQFPESRIGVFRPRTPQLFYFDARPSTDVFIGASSRFQIIDEYEDVLNWRADSLAHCWDFEDLQALAREGRATALVHLPTTYRHHEVFRPQLLDAFPGLIELPSVFWDLPLQHGKRVGWRATAELDAAQCPQQALVYRERARSIFREHLRDHLPTEAALQAQVDLFAERSWWQALHSYGLRNALAGRRFHIVVTDHDTGLNGPLFSLAAESGSQVTVLPHSSYPTGAIAHGVGVEAVERNGFGTLPRGVWGEPVRCRGVQLTASVPPHRLRTEVRSLTMLVNGMISNGLFYIDFLGLVAFHRELAARCAAAGVSFRLRLKPSAPGVDLIAAGIGKSVDSLREVMAPSIEDLAAQTDLCVSFGQPTSGTISFLASGCCMLHVSSQYWPADSAFAPAYFGDGLVPVDTPQRTLDEVSVLLNDVQRFRALAQKQHAGFLARSSSGPQVLFPAALADR